MEINFLKKLHHMKLYHFRKYIIFSKNFNFNFWKVIFRFFYENFNFEKIISLFFRKAIFRYFRLYNFQKKNL